MTGPNGYRTAFTLRSGESLTLTELAAGEYTVTEDVEGAAIADRRLYVTGGGTVSVPEGGTGAVTVTNEYLRPDLPDPNDPDSPDTVTIWDDDVPRTYVKVWDPEDEEWEWIPEEDVPLMSLNIPDTGDTNAVVRWGLLTLAALAGVVVLFFTELRAKRRDK